MVTVGPVQIPIKFTFRAMIDFEKMTGKSIQEATGTEDIVMLFYCTAKAGAKDMKTSFPYTFDQFLDEVDNFPESIISFYEAINSTKDGEPEEKKQTPKEA